RLFDHRANGQVPDPGLCVAASPPHSERGTGRSLVRFGYGPGAAWLAEGVGCGPGPGGYASDQVDMAVSAGVSVVSGGAEMTAPSVDGVVSVGVPEGAGASVAAAVG